MTEDEAKTKTCCGPQVVAMMIGLASPNMTHEFVDNPGRCCASACMAWRTRHQWLDNAQQTPDWVSYAPYAFQPGPGQERDDGFCGLAGEPR